MDILIPILFIIAMVYSEVSKKKKEDADMDLSDLMSFDDFVDKKSSNFPSSSSSYTNKPSYSPPSRGKKNISSSNNKQKKSMPPKLTIPPCPIEHSNKKNKGKDSLDMEWGNPKLKKATNKKRVSMKLTKNELVKSFIFSEILQRYDINRIYDRIPGVNRDE